jgi:hypothetical protein
VDREFDAMKEAVAGGREVALELEEHLGMVGLGIRLERSLGGFGSVGYIFFSSRFALWDSCELLL